MTAPNAADRPSAAPPATTGAYAPADSANLVRVLDEYLADLQAGRPADRSRLHPAGNAGMLWVRALTRLRTEMKRAMNEPRLP